MKKGLLITSLAYFLWGFFPLYFKLLIEVPSMQILGHRIFWSFIFMSILLLLRREWKPLFAKITRRTALVYFLAGLLLAVNWGTYVWAVNSGHVVEASLGYFINPLVSVLLGTLILREKLRMMQWIPIAITAAGVLYLTLTYGAFPWISLVLAISFGLYGLVKKIAPFNPQEGLFLETAMIVPPTLLYLIFCEVQGSGAFLHTSLHNNFLLVLSGIITAIPLLMFAAGAHDVPLVTIGLLQYIAPTIQFLIGVLVYHEAFTAQKLIGFGIIWFALILFSAESLLQVRRSHHLAAAAPSQPAYNAAGADPAE
jgi:chloramphenicol-sensitive protein RarD